MTTRTLSLSDAVGIDSPNRPKDVRIVQQLLNSHRHLVSGGREIPCDGIVGPKTIAAIMNFQRAVVNLHNADGQVDRGGKTFKALCAAPSPAGIVPSSIVTLKLAQPLLFPMRKRPIRSYKIEGRTFGAPRDKGKRAHAGCDLLASPGTEILSVADGEVHQNVYYFYSGTNALEVIHPDGWIVRYGEIANAMKGIAKGSKVRRGQVIAQVGQLDSGSSMLHFEMYSGSDSGSLTVRGNRPYQRRSDLIDPTAFLDAAVSV